MVLNQLFNKSTGCTRLHLKFEIDLQETKQNSYLKENFFAFKVAISSFDQSKPINVDIHT